MKINKNIIITCLVIFLTSLTLISFHKKTLGSLNMTTINGEKITSEDLLGKVVLINFWATDCVGCIAEMPYLVDTYNKYKNQNFTVYSVSLDQQKDKWLNAINQDQLIWPNHVSELTGWKSTPGEKYGVTSIPKTFLIDKNGMLQQEPNLE